MTDQQDVIQDVPEAVAALAVPARRVCVLTGAGMSAESGVPTFRDVQVGLWEHFDPGELATPEAWERNPEQVWAWYSWRATLVRRAQPNAGHVAIARWQQLPDVDLTIATQNVDDLHERAGSRRVVHMHGRLRHVRCEECGARLEWEGTLVDEPPCPECDRPALRPDVVWFGEYPYGMDEIHAAIEQVDVFAAIGTSGVVYPAAGFVDYAHAVGAHTVELNTVATGGDFHTTYVGPATEVVPRWVEDLLAGRLAALD